MQKSRKKNITNISSPKTVSRYVHPFIELVERKASSDEMINTMATYLDISTTEDEASGEKAYYMVDQCQFIAPVLQVFSYSVSNGLVK